MISVEVGMLVVIGGLVSGGKCGLGRERKATKEKVLACSAIGEIGYERNVAQKRDTRDTDDEQAKI